VAVVGRTLDCGLSASVGILGAVGGPRRTWRGEQVERFLRLDVNSYPSQAGAAVVLANGAFLGMATAAMLRHSTVAVPGETLDRIADELLTQGKIRQGYLGVGLQLVAVPEKLRAETGRAAKSGLMVLSIEPGTSAEEGGLELGDILVASGETLLEDPETLQGALRGDAVGKPMKFTVLRAGRAVEIELRIAARRA
jgi:S1-C subfamily serine protease